MNLNYNPCKIKFSSSSSSSSSLSLCAVCMFVTKIYTPTYYKMWRWPFLTMLTVQVTMVNNIESEVGFCIDRRSWASREIESEVGLLKNGNSTSVFI